MPRKRMIDPGFWTDPHMGRATPHERLLFIGMMSNADDEGRLSGDPDYLRATIFPYDNFTYEDVKAMRDHLTEVNPNVRVYENGGREYIQLRRWAVHQKPRYPQPSKLPPAPDEDCSESPQDCSESPQDCGISYTEAFPYREGRGTGVGRGERLNKASTSTIVEVEGGESSSPRTALKTTIYNNLNQARASPQKQRRILVEFCRDYLCHPAGKDPDDLYAQVGRMQKLIPNPFELFSFAMLEVYERETRGDPLWDPMAFLWAVVNVRARDQTNKSESQARSPPH